MNLRKNLFILCLVTVTLCLVASYLILGNWLGLVIALLTGFTWWFARKYPASGLPLLCLLASICLAVAARLMGSPAWLTICSAGFALVVWDLLLLDVALEGNSFTEQTRQYENKHLQSLSLTLVFGLLAALLGRLLNFQPPFALLILLVALVAFGLDRVWGYLKKRNMHIP
jgi:hypothetical protein